MRRLAAGLALAVVAVVALAAPASAHAQLESTEPTAGAILETAPSEVVVRFNEPVEVRSDAVRLHDATGDTVETGELEREDGGRTLRLSLDDLDDGGYVLTWRVLSADAHPISGGVTWRVGEASDAVDQGLLQDLLNAEGGDASVPGVAAGFRALLFASLVVLVGGLVFLIAVWPDGGAVGRLRRALVVAAAVGAVATVAGMGLQGADISGGGLTDAWRPATIADTLDTTYGRAAVARLVLLVVLGLLAAAASPVVARTMRWQLASLSAAALALLTVTLSGHARTGRWTELAVPVDLVHLGAAAVWIGGLAVLTLVVLPLDDDGEARPLVTRFSTIAAVCVLAVVVTGVIQGVRQLEDLDALRTTSYGRLLVIKVAVVALLVVLGALSRSLVRRRLDDELEPEEGDEPEDEDGEFLPTDPADARRSLRRAVGAETALAVVVLVATSLLVAADPARTLSDTGFSEAKVVESTVIEAVAAPARTGPVDIHLFVSDPSFGLTTEVEGAATLALPDRDIPPVPVPLRNVGRGHWSAYDVDIPIRGDWRLDVTVTIGDFDQRRAVFTLPID